MHDTLPASTQEAPLLKTRRSVVGVKLPTALTCYLLVLPIQLIRDTVAAAAKDDVDAILRVAASPLVSYSPQALQSRG